MWFIIGGKLHLNIKSSTPYSRHYSKNVKAYIEGDDVIHVMLNKSARDTASPERFMSELTLTDHQNKPSTFSANLKERLGIMEVTGFGKGFYSMKFELDSDVLTSEDEVGVLVEFLHSQKTPNEDILDIVCEVFSLPRDDWRVIDPEALHKELKEDKS